MPLISDNFISLSSVHPDKKNYLFYLYPSGKVRDRTCDHTWKLYLVEQKQYELTESGVKVVLWKINIQLNVNMCTTLTYI